MSQAENMDAINQYMRTTPLKTPEAFSIKDSFIRWWDNLGWYDKSVNDGAYDEASTRRNQLNIANQPTEAKKTEVRDVLSRGQTDGRPIDVETGRVGTQVTKPTVAATPSTQPKSGQPSVTPVAPQGSAPVPLNRVLSQGVTDGGKGDVKAWQTFLGIVPPTGNFASITTEKTKAWQKSKGLVADGKVGPATWAMAFPPNKATAPAPDAFAPTPVQPKPADVFAPSPKPAAASKPKAQASSTKPAPKPETVKEKAKATTKKVADTTKKAAAAVNQAGIFSIGTWPLWAKVAGILTIVGAAGAAAMGQKPKRFLMGGR